MQEPTSQGGYGLLWKTNLLIDTEAFAIVWPAYVKPDTGILAEECAERIVNQYIPIFDEFREKARVYIEELKRTKTEKDNCFFDKIPLLAIRRNLF